VPFALTPRPALAPCVGLLIGLASAPALVAAQTTTNPSVNAQLLVAARQADLPALERALGQGGKVSFSFYLLHMGLLHIFAARVGVVAPTGNAGVDAAIMLAVSYGATWALATLSYHIVEEPFLRMRRNYGAGRTTAVAAVS
jgi:peptidoglycan/LPS O-acetylase OafA/YrhL